MVGFVKLWINMRSSVLVTDFENQVFPCQLTTFAIYEHDLVPPLCKRNFPVRVSLWGAITERCNILPTTSPHLHHKKSTHNKQIARIVIERSIVESNIPLQEGSKEREISVS